MNENNSPHPLAEKMRFTGNCPECAMKGESSEMLLNSMDFFECPQCHLQVTAFPDAVAILKWRGDGDFRQTAVRATEGFVGQQLFASSREAEIFPDKGYCLIDFFDLEEYITSIHSSQTSWKKIESKSDGFDFSKQERHLASIELEHWENLIGLWRKVENNGVASESFEELTNELYDRGIIFDFPWQSWNEGMFNIREDVMPDTLSLLEISMYLTLILRESRLNATPIFAYDFLQKLFHKLIAAIRPTKS